MANELKRRLVHLGGAAVPAAYVLDRSLGFGYVTWGRVRLLVLAGVLAVAVLEVVRLGGDLEWRLFDELTREYERDNPAGYALYVLGGAVAVLAFEPRIAVPALFMLTVGDPLSGLLGSGELRQVKGPYVLLAMFGFSTLVARAFVPAVPALLGGLTATAADGVKPVVRGYVVDDNLTIPVGAACAMWLGVTYL